MDIPAPVRETVAMLEPGRVRQRLASRLNAAFAEGLLSEQTLDHRLGLVFGPRLIDPASVIGDLSLRTYAHGSRARRVTATLAFVGRVLSGIFRRDEAEPVLPVLALDWSGTRDDLIVGRGPGCDISLSNRTVSRQHARLIFRDGAWIVHDLGSKNGLSVNGVAVGRCRLYPGDRLGLGLQVVDID